MHTRHSREGENPEWMGEGPIPPSHSHHVIPSAARNLPPSLRVRGPGGCTRLIPGHSRAGGNPEGTGWENHGNLSPIMAIMVQNLSPFAFTSYHSEQSEESQTSIARCQLRCWITCEVEYLLVPPQVEQHEYGECSAIIAIGLLELGDCRSCRPNELRNRITREFF